MAFRLMHLQGRLLPSVLRGAVPDIRDYTYMEGEVIAGMTLGWEFRRWPSASRRSRKRYSVKSEF